MSGLTSAATSLECADVFALRFDVTCRVEGSGDLSPHSKSINQPQHRTDFFATLTKSMRVNIVRRMKKTLCLVSLLALLTGGCAWYKIQPVSADSLNDWGKTGRQPGGYVFYQPELYFAATIVTESAGATNKQNITVTPIWLPNYQKPYRVTTHNFLAKADFTFNFENGWKLTSIADKGDNSTMANTLAGQLATVLKTTGAAEMGSASQPAPKTRLVLYRPTFNSTNGYFNGFEQVGVTLTE